MSEPQTKEGIPVDCLMVRCPNKKFSLQINSLSDFVLPLWGSCLAIGSGCRE
jgi:hypothetical protein